MVLKKIVNHSLTQYIFFAILTSVINVLAYLISYKFIIQSIIICNIIAYTLSIILSFVFNKKIVFKNNDKNILRQMIGFLIVKFISFIIDSVVLILCNKVLLLNNFWSKIISNCSTTANNYFWQKNKVFK